MKIKKPSLKGMKNTKYLGHFAKDEYIQQGHNFSGTMPLFREPSQIEMMGPSNPFDVRGELQRREQQVNAEVAALRAQTPDNTPKVAAAQAAIDKTLAGIERGRRYGYSGMEYQNQLQFQRQALERAKSQSKEGREASYRASRKKFLTEV